MWQLHLFYAPSVHVWGKHFFTQPAYRVRGLFPEWLCKALWKELSSFHSDFLIKYCRRGGDHNTVTGGPLSSKIKQQEQGSHGNRHPGVPQGGPVGGVQEGDLAAEQHRLQYLELFSIWPLWITYQGSFLQQFCRSYGEDHGGDGHPWQGHRCEGQPPFLVKHWVGDGKKWWFYLRECWIIHITSAYFLFD